MSDKSVPTGQMVLHQVRPLRQASTAIMTSITAAMTNDDIERSHISEW